ncbi:DUF2802 domain-containing protein [Aliikangiella sp. IMCC44359]|uniref:DUF2802 domain-containing protein n=1 Tax=Aliikangiella sp. IMCC44359 TaxID=3459125 RepID=UPI00403ACA10
MIDWLLQIVEQVSVVSSLLAVALLVVGYYLFQLNQQHLKLNKKLTLLQNEVRAMNSGQLGMGREIRKVAQEIASVETSQQQQIQQSDPISKNFDQAGLLLSRGATIEEVVEAFDISPAEAELLAIMRNSAPSHTH